MIGFCHSGQSTPRRIWSSSMLSNSALKLPSPKPSLPLRWMISKKIGPITFWVKICSSRPCPSRRAVHQDAPLLQLGDVLAMAFDALAEQLVIGVGRVLERNAAAAR